MSHTTMNNSLSIAKAIHMYEKLKKMALHIRDCNILNI